MAILKIKDNHGVWHIIKALKGKDGINLEFEWNGTKLGVKTSEEKEFKYVDLKGETGQTGATGMTGNSIKNIEKLSTKDNVDTYAVNFTDGTQTTFNVRNGEVSLDELKEVDSKVESNYEEFENLTTEVNVIRKISSNNNLENNSQNINSEITTDTTRKNSKELIEQFVKYCNNNQIEDAYSMISKDCKSVLFPNINTFKNNYIKKIFNQNKTAKVEKEIYGNGIYKVTYMNNILQSGGKSDKQIIDYIYVTDDGENKVLSLNKFLYIKEIGIESKNKRLNIEVIEKQIFIDYEIYTIKITNNTENEILIANQNDINNINLTDENDVKYSSYIDELATEILVVQQNGKKTINIKFNKTFNTDRKIKYMNFNVIMDYNAYKKGQDFETLKYSVQL